MTIDTSIFKAYDIRGLYPTQVNTEFAYMLGLVYSFWLKKQLGKDDLTIAVARDGRLSGQELKSALIKGLMQGGAAVLDFDMVSTPTFYYGVATNTVDGGIQVSASHNPKDWNGFKIVRAGAVPVGKESGLPEIADLMQDTNLDSRFRGNDKKLSADREHAVYQIGDVVSHLVDQVLADVPSDRIKPFTIVADCANAVAALDLQKLFNKVPQVKLIPLHFDIDGAFPGHGEADPMKEENLYELCERVITEKADLGIATDGDGDRYFFVDNAGQIIPQPIIRGLAAQIALKEQPDALVAYDIRPGRITQDMIDEVGGKSIVTLVGHSLIKQKMIQTGAVFGGESSGHYFYKLPSGIFEVPLLLVMKLLGLMSERGQSIADIIAPYNKYFNTGEINTEVTSREAVVHKIALIKERYSDGQISEMDGLLVTYPDVWFIVRGSNTEPKLRLIVESGSKERMERMRDEVLQLIRS